MESVTVAEAAEYLGVTPPVVRGLLSAGFLHGEKVDRVWRVGKRSVEVFYERSRGAAMVAPAPLSPEQEFELAKRHLCPVCQGTFQGHSGHGSEWSGEFRECKDCGFSLHESFIDARRPEMTRNIREHLEKLVLRVQQGERARECLKRREELTGTS